MSVNAPPLKRPKIRVFNPHRLKADELEESFIARQELFRSILDDLASARPEASPQHHLVIGQRGMGKTTLLRRLALELHREPYCQRLLPLNFPEEQYIEVDRLSKFWLNCLDATADALEHENQADIVKQIDDEVIRLTKIRTDETTYHEACRDAFTAVWRGIGRRPVLFIDNFNLLLGRLRNDDYSLRGYFSSAGAPILVAASTVYPDQMADYGAAFYDGFKPYYLYPLTLEEVRDVLIHLARIAQRPGLVDRIYQEQPRLAALRDLTGGNPRTAVLLFELFSDGFSEDAFEDLDALLDLVTPLYQSRLDQLSELAQTIVGTLARNWSPMSKADIVAQARLVDSSVPPQLGRLKEIGLVEEAELFPSKKTGYQIAERFFNIWYLMRFSSRRERASLSCLTRFLEEFHTPAERTRSANELLRRDGLSRGNITYAMALAGSLQSEPTLARELELKAQLELIQQMDGVREKIAAILDPDEIPHAVYGFAELKQRLEQVVPPGSSVTGQEFAQLVLGSPSLVPGGAGNERLGDRASIAASTLSVNEIKRLVKELRNEAKVLAKRYSAESIDWLRSRLNAGTLTSWRDAEGLSSLILLAPDRNSIRLAREFGHIEAKQHLSDAAFEKLCIMMSMRPSTDATAKKWFDFAYDARVEFGRYSGAEQAYCEAIRIDPNYAWPWNNLGNLLQEHLARYEESEQAYREAIRIDPNYAWPWNNLGNLLKDHLARYEESEQAYREAIRIDPNNAVPWNNLGSLLRDHLARYEESEQAYREAIRIDLNYAWAWHNLGLLLQEHLARYEESEQAYREAIRINPNEASAWHNLGNLLQVHLARYAESEQAYREAIRIDPNYARPWNGLGNLLFDYLGRFDEAVNAYRRALQIGLTSDSARMNLAFLLRDVRHQFNEAKALLQDLCHPDDARDTQALQNALFAAYANDWTAVATFLRSGLSLIGGRLPPKTRDDWFRASAVLLHLGFGDQFVELLEETGADQTLLPWFAAVRAHALGDKRHLVNLPVEARAAAQKIFDEIDRRRKQLPPFKQ